MMTIKIQEKVSKLCFFICVALACLPINAQKSDLGIWYNISARYEIIKNLRINISEEMRTASNASKVDQYFTDLGLDYTLNKYVSVGGYYRCIRKREVKDEFYARNRFYGEINLTYPFQRIELSYRFRFQQQKHKYAEDVEEKVARLYNRHKFAIEYNIPGIKLTPSAFYERFYRLKYISSYFFDSERYGLDLNYKFNKKHRASAGFLVDKDLHPNTDILYVFTLAYRYSIK